MPNIMIAITIRDYLKPQYDEHGIMYVGVEQFLLDDGVLYWQCAIIVKK